MIRRLHVLTSFLAFVVFAVLFDSYALSRPQHILALVPRPTEGRPRHFLALIPRHRPAEAPPRPVPALLPRSSDPCRPAPVSTPFSMSPDALALARVLLSEGDRSGAEHEVREVWRSEELSPKLEAEILAAFPEFLTRADHATRMDRRIGARDFTTAMRAAARVGASYASIVKACVAVAGKEKRARALLEKVPGELHQNLGYLLCRIQWLVNNEGTAEAVRLMLEAPREAMARQDTDQWWRERRVLARKLLDVGDAKTAYQIVRGAASPANEYYRAEAHFMAGWIALRSLSDPKIAFAHFQHVDDGSTNTGAVAQPRQPVEWRRHARITRRLPGIPRRIMARWRAPVSG